MRTVSGLFDTYDQVVMAIDQLSDAGISSSEISVVTPHNETVAATTGGAGVGAAIGGLGGLLAGLVAMSLPGLGPVMGVGWLLTTLAGAAAGGLAGGLIAGMAEAGVDRDDAEVYAEGIRRGSTLIVVRADDVQASEVRDILTRAGSVDTHSRRSEFRADGWDGFASKDIWDDDIGSEDREKPGERTVVTPVPGMR